MAVLARLSRGVPLAAGTSAIITMAFDLKAKMTIPLFPELVRLYSMALSPMPVTTLAFATPYAPFIAAAICSGETDAAEVASGKTSAKTRTVVLLSAVP